MTSRHISATQSVDFFLCIFVKGMRVHKINLPFLYLWYTISKKNMNYKKKKQNDYAQYNYLLITLIAVVTPLKISYDLTIYLTDQHNLYHVIIIN